jgi:HlyD family secretion protein
MSPSVSVGLPKRSAGPRPATDGPAPLPFLVVDPTALSDEPRVRTTRRRRRAWIALLGALALAAAAPSAGRFAGLIAPGGGTAEIGSAPSGSSLRSERPVVGLGLLLPAGDVVRVAAPSGTGDVRLERLLVAEGDRVEPGAVLAVLDNEARQRAALALARAEADQKAAALARTRLDVETTRAQRQAALDRARAELDTARADLDRTRTLSLRGFAAASNLDQKELVWRQASERVAEAEAAWRRFAQAGDGQADIALARQELATAEAAIVAAQADLAQTSIRAPSAGRVLDIHVRPGERLGTTGLLDLGATDAMMVKAEIYESDVGRLAAGQAATVTALPLGAPLAGTVERIGLHVQRQAIVDESPAANTDARVVEVWIRLDAPSSERASRFTNLQTRVRIEP